MRGNKAVMYPALPERMRREPWLPNPLDSAVRDGELPIWSFSLPSNPGGLLGLPTLLFEGAGLHVPHLLDGWLEPIYEVAEHGAHAEHHLSVATEFTLFLISSIVAVGGIAVAYLFYIKNPAIPQNLARNSRPIFEILVNKYYIDEISKVREYTLEEFKKRDDAWLLKPDEDWFWGPTNNWCKWFHVCEHESNHNGQIKWLKGRM